MRNREDRTAVPERVALGLEVRDLVKGVPTMPSKAVSLSLGRKMGGKVITGKVMKRDSLGSLPQGRPTFYPF